MWLNGLPSTYNNKIDAYYGVLGSYGDVGTYGAYPRSGCKASKRNWRAWRCNWGGEWGRVWHGGLQPVRPFHCRRASASYFRHPREDDQNSWSNDITSVANDGLVPDFSGRFDGATVAKTVSCVNSTHMDMVEGTGGNCTDKAENSTGPLFQLLDADLESLVNPVPTATLLSPASAAPDGPPFTLAVTGTNFVTSSIVEWNGGARATTFVSSSQLTAAIQAADIASTGTASVTVVNPSPGGGTSSALTFTVTSVSTSIAISSLSNASLTLVPGGASQTITVSLSRSNYTGSITLATSNLPSGVTAKSPSRNGNSGSIALQAASNAAVVPEPDDHRHRWRQRSQFRHGHL